MFRKLNLTHLALVIALPITLILINPNWIFNAGIADDFIYLGYQLDFPKYIGWAPSSLMYFIERFSFTLPAYFVRQITSPLLANFIIHLSVYYLAVFSVYGILNRLFNARIALIITLLVGQYPLIMRATGWDYLDGYVVATFALTIYFLTQAVGSKRDYLYLIGAGSAFALMFNANSFNVLYAPALGAYYILLSDWRNQILPRFIKTGIYTALGAGITTGILVIIYFALTQNVLYENSIRISQLTVASQFAYYFLTTYGKFIHPHWIFLFVAVASTIIFRPLVWRRAKFTDSENPHIRNYRVILRAMLGLFSISLLILGYYQFQGYVFSRLHFYNTNWALVAFLMLGVVLAPRLNQENGRLYRFAPYLAFFIPMLPLAIFSLYPDIFTIFNHYVLYIGALICLIVMFFPRMVIIGLVGFAMFTGAMLNESREYLGYHYPPRIDVYVADRYVLQDIYLKTIEITQLINPRYDSFNLDKFRIFYVGSSPHRRLFDAVSGVYLWSWDRTLSGSNMVEQIERAERPFEEIVVLSHVDETEQTLAKLDEKIQFTVLESHTILFTRGDIVVTFIQFNALDEPEQP
ncbi:MAG: glycosyltransferase family 39 protein [Anaerolineae bacterium]|nr:glycosyltransferase family 39 protein [Anaerolineae bacterium]